MEALAQLLFVVETDDIAKTDDAYYLWILKAYFRKYIEADVNGNLSLQYKFVHMGGKTNYKSDDVKSEVSFNTNAFLQAYKKPTFVVYCFDVDSTSNENIKFIDEVTEYCRANNYDIVFSYKEIESVFDIPKTGTKVDKVKYFASHNPKTSSLSPNRFFVPYKNIFDNDGSTNFNLIINKIINSL